MRLRGDAWRACRSTERSAPSIAGSWPEGGCWRPPGSTASGPFGCGSGAWRTCPALSCGDGSSASVPLSRPRTASVFVVADEAGPVTIRDSGTGDPLRVLPLEGEGAAGDRLLIGVGLGGDGVPARAGLELANWSIRRRPDVSRSDRAADSQPRRLWAGGRRRPRPRPPDPRFRRAPSV